MCICPQEVPKLGRVVTGTVTRLDTTSATLASGQVLHFDFVAICTGSSYSSNLGKSITSVTKVERLNELQVCDLVHTRLFEIRTISDVLPSPCRAAATLRALLQSACLNM